MAYIQRTLPLPKPGLHRSISIAGGNIGVCTDLGQQATHHLGQEAAHQGVSLSQGALADLGGLAGLGQEAAYQEVPVSQGALGNLGGLGRFGGQGGLGDLRDLGQKAAYPTVLGGLKPRVRGGLRPRVRCEFFVCLIFWLRSIFV